MILVILALAIFASDISQDFYLDMSGKGNSGNAGSGSQGNLGNTGTGSSGGPTGSNSGGPSGPQSPQSNSFIGHEGLPRDDYNDTLGSIYNSYTGIEKPNDNPSANPASNNNNVESSNNRRYSTRWQQ